MTHSASNRKLRESNATITDERWLDMAERIYNQNVVATNPDRKKAEELAHAAGLAAKIFCDRMCPGPTAVLCRDERKLRDGFPEERWSEEDWEIHLLETAIRHGVDHDIDDLNGELSQERKR